MVRGWFDECSQCAKTLDSYWWGMQSAELPPNKVLVQIEGEDNVRLIDKARYDALEMEWRSMHPHSQAVGTMVAWWGGENLSQFIINRMRIGDIKSAE